MMRERATKGHRARLVAFACIAAGLAAACSTQPTLRTLPAPASETPPVVTAPPPLPKSAIEAPSREPLFRAVAWNDLPGWREDDLAQAWQAFSASCAVLATREGWGEVCSAASTLQRPDEGTVRRFFEKHFTPYVVASAESGEEGLITGYYEPLLRGSRTRSERYRYPLYRVPPDLITVELAGVYPELKNMRLRGRVDGRRLGPYPDRAQIDNGAAALRGYEIAWVDDAIDLFFLHIQGSGRIQLDNGETLRVGYADQNGHPYRAIGRLLVQEGELAAEDVSMQSIKAWLRQSPDRAQHVLNSNPSYVFFRELPSTTGGPPGALGVPLTAGRSIAVDPRIVPLGAPVFIATTWPGNAQPLNRLTIAQDTGGAIRGAVRADFFWGSGESAEREAGRMKERLRMWVLLPQGYSPPSAERTSN